LPDVQINQEHFRSLARTKFNQLPANVKLLFQAEEMPRYRYFGDDSSAFDQFLCD
jgi:uncharacterized protein (DUF169 family)